jgi:D-sedoheptulose 7-phosphate isomerase
MSNQRELEALYPFLQPDRQAPAQIDAALADSVLQKALDSRKTNERFFTEQAAVLIAAARALAGIYRKGGRLFTMGNGGSSCDAAHVAVEFLHPVTAGRPALAAINLAADTSMLSAVGNDVGFEHVFVRQLLAHARAEDAVLGISASGNSANLLAAFAKAKQMGLLTLGFSGSDGGRMKHATDVDYCLVVPSTSIHRIQECHVTAYHILWDLVHTLLADERGPASVGDAPP